MSCNYFAICNSPCFSSWLDCRVFKYLQAHLRKLAPINGFYYDLIRLPHGHFPVPKANLWARLPLPIKEFRGEGYYECPSCGMPSFFKIEYACRDCEDCFDYSPETESWRINKRRRKYFRKFYKRIEYLFLPLLVLTGKAWYVLASSRRSPSVRLMHKEGW
jgi:hypothetical protein